MFEEFIHTQLRTRSIFKILTDICRNVKILVLSDITLKTLMILSEVFQTPSFIMRVFGFSEYLAELRISYIPKQSKEF